MPVRSRTLLRAAAVLLGGLALVYFLFGWFGFEPVARWALPKLVAERSGRHLAIEQARFDPLRLSVELRGLRLSEPDGRPLLSLGRLFLDFEAASLFKRAYTFNDVQLSTPVMQVEIRADGRLNWLEFIDALAGPATEPASAPQPPPRLLVRHLAIEKGRVDLADLRIASGFRTSIDPLQLELDHLSTLPEDRGDYTLSARTGIGASVRWKGSLGLNPVLATGDIAIDDLQLARLWPYLQDRLNMVPPQGVAALTVGYRVSPADRRLNLVLDKIEAGIGQLALGGKADPAASIQLDTLRLHGGRLDLAKQEASFESVQAEGGRVATEIGADGRPRLLDWLPRAEHAPAPAPVPSTPARAGPTPLPAPSAPALATSTPAATAATPAASGASAPAVTAPAAAAPGAPAPAAAASPPGQRASTASGWRFGINQVKVDRLALDLADRGFVKPLRAQAGELGLQFKLQGLFGGTDTQFDIDGLGLRLAALKLSSGPDATPWLQLASFEVQDGRASLAGREASVGQVVLNGARVEVVRDAQGHVSIRQALERAAKGATATATATATAAATAGASSKAPPAPIAAPGGTAAPHEDGWHYRIGKVEARDFGLALREESVKPALSLTLDDINAAVEGVSDNLQAELPVRLQFRVRQGGRFEASGKVSPGAAAADLRLKLDELALAPAQPFLAQRTNLVLSGGSAHTAGRLQAQGGRFSYDGTLAIRQLRINEAGSGEPVLGWKALTVPRLAATPDRLRIGAVTLDGLDSKLVIFKDRSVNLARLMKREGAPDVPPPAAPAVPATPAPAAAPATARKPAAPDYRVDVERVHVSNGAMDFADLSLALPFSARIHGLKGDLVGLSSQPDAAAQLELDGGVDEFGLARAVGQIKLSNPTGYTDIKVVFRNVEMTTLTPYSATFAGRKIQSGKLSLDLDYKIKDRQLAGNNQVVMDKLVLGERVESPTATNLPLDLAIAILQDADGQIDLGLPVSGSLDDPQFSYGQIIWKAVVNVITKIATAPFRALGALLGVDSEKLDKISFDAGSASLLPPEREKLANLAQLMARRPGLGLVVQAAYAPQADRTALREMHLRRAVALKQGRTLAPDEEPGPISTAQPDTREALEKLYAERLGAPALATLQQQHQQANPGPPPPTAGGRLVSRLSSLFKTAPSPLTAEDAEKLRGADIHALMLQRLLDADAIDDARLRELANARAEAIRGDIVGRGVAAERVRVDAAQGREMAESEGSSVAATLSMAVGGAGANRADAASAPGVGPAAGAASGAAR